METELFRVEDFEEGQKYTNVCDFVGYRTYIKTPEKIKNFSKEYKALCKKYNLAIHVDSAGNITLDVPSEECLSLVNIETTGLGNLEVLNV